MTTMCLQLVSASIGEFLVSGTVNVDVGYSIEESIEETYGPYQRLARDLFIDYTDLESIDELEIEHPNWDESVFTSEYDDNTTNLNLWTSVLNSQSDDWWEEQLIGANDIWEHIDD